MNTNQNTNNAQSMVKLPIDFVKGKIQELLTDKDKLVLVAETGSGKSTRLPVFLAEMESIRRRKGKIVCTQPRSATAIRYAMQVAETEWWALGSEVGYDVGFDHNYSDKTFLKFMTDSALLRDLIADKQLKGVKAVILDEVHERTIATDMLLTLLKNKRPDMKLVIMSATPNGDEYASYYNAPVLEVSGCEFSVQVKHVERAVSNYIAAAVNLCMQILVHPEVGDVLIFLPGAAEIHDAIDLMREELNGRPATLLPLYSSLSQEEEAKAFATPQDGSRKFIFATNYAEASVTVATIRFVVDSGLSEQKCFDPLTRVEALKTLPISQASANQRRGRAGRTAPGYCFRLYTEEAYFAMPVNPTPTILNMNLAGNLLHMLTADVNINNLQWYSKPTDAALQSAREQLAELGAIDADCRITFEGNMLAALTLEVDWAAAVVHSLETVCAEEVITIAALVSCSPILHTPNSPDEDKQKALDAHRRFTHYDGDLLTLLNVFRAFDMAKNKKQFCLENFLSYAALREASKLRKHLFGRAEWVRERLYPYGPLNLNLAGGNITSQQSDTIRRSIVAGLFRNVIFNTPCELGEQWYTLDTNAKVRLGPGCTLNSKTEKFALYSHLTQNRDGDLLVMQCIRIRPQWLFELGRDYMNKDRFAPAVVQLFTDAMPSGSLGWDA